MQVLALTILVSCCLAGIFLVCFVLENRRVRRGSPERDSLLPLDAHRPAVLPPPTATTVHHNQP